MALLPQNPRDQRLVIVAILAVGLAGVYQQLYWTPKRDDLHLIEVRLDTLDSLNKVAKLEVAKGTATKMKQEADAYARELNTLRHLVPTSNEVPPLLESISNAARSAGLELSAVAPDGVIQGDQFDTYKYKIGVVGPYHKVGAFLANIGSLPRIVAPINLSLNPTSRTGELRPKRDEAFLDASFGIETYVAHGPPPGPTAAKPGAP
ncbi:MAG TPA: type 4a pilus biogenesis protein PilO [Gemmatimonadaceae bacterium]|nr:type 4a pilus biogenesis protein PilO [Gemmatimonadaceae bacterium]